MGTYYGTLASEIIDPLDPSDDYIFADDGDDTVYGWDGNDFLVGWEGDDRLFGESANDTLWAGNGNDFLSGGNGNDQLAGWNDNDSLYGDDGNDDLYGDEGNDLLIGDEYDTLTGGGGADIFEVGSSSDAYYNKKGLYAGDGYAVITDFNWAENDKFQVHGSISDYFLGTFNWFGSDALDTGIYYQGDLIAVAQDRSGSDILLANDFNFVV